jgi:2-polyprenyl-3-methyl-5-hydroxy-6-metoxy-1,4-benzoquinol methylase
MFDSVDGWYNSFKIGNVENTNTMTSLNYQMWISQIIPTDLNGMKILDIGANDGFYSFLCESRGAERIFAIDNNKRELSNVSLKRLREFTENNPNGSKHSLGSEELMFKNTGPTERFQILKKILNSKVDYKLMNVYDVDSIEETFDIALLFGVYYHLENPVLAFQKIFPKINDSLFLSGHIIETGEPKMYQNPSYWDSMSHLAPSDRPREQNPRWIASSEYLLRIGEKIGFKKCVLLDTLNEKFTNYYKETSQTVSRRPYSSTANSDTNDLLYESKIGLFKFSK